MRALVVGVSLVLLACNASPSAGAKGSLEEAGVAAARVGSCDRGSINGTCSDYDAAYLAQNEGLLKSSCAKLGGAFVYAECPNTSVVGACKLSTTESRKFYGTGASAYDAPRAQKECESTFHGAWTAR